MFLIELGLVVVSFVAAFVVPRSFRIVCPVERGLALTYMSNAQR
jgi:hypothetical protein